MKNRKLLLIVSLVLALTMSLGGTLAYLTDTDADVNTMVLGNVKITQNEQERDANGELVGFNQNKPALPAVYANGTATGESWAEKGVEFNGVEYKVFDDSMKNVIDKMVTVTNDGNSDAYVRTLIAIEAPDYDPNDLIHINWNSADCDMSAPVCVTINDVKYVVFAYTYKAALAPKATTAPSLLQLFLDPVTTNEDVAKFGPTWEVLALSQAIQADGFSDPMTALNAGFGAVTDAKVIEWFGGWKTWQEDGKINTPSEEWPSNAPVEEAVPVVTDAPALQAALDAAVAGDNTIMLGANIAGNVTITQKEGVNIVLEGAGFNFNGVLTVFGNGNQAGAEKLTIKNIDFVAANGAASCIVSPDRSINNKYSYAHNVAVIGCTFTDPDGTVNCAAIRHQDGGDKDWTVLNCTVDNTMHSLLQINNVNGKLTVDGCTVESKNGINLNSCTNVEVKDCEFDVTGYAIRFGVDSGSNPDDAKNFVIKNSTLRSLCNDGDAVIIFRVSAANSNTTLTMENATLIGSKKFEGDANIIKN